ncbi:General secretion pathway, M protein [Vibrio mediterranei]|uniref:MSHA biogenesis protein MshJ n=1 Tax=Vibrio mediterranei TaxID=689 RepID=A0ABX5D4E7_9VIBR|nr:type II secretion system protein GspM [Vibrio mediterranei]MCG9623844.1 type II secretion system protein GspM [Vibrio mediterranei]MCG9659412.1 type II secretion system protein GspM [Vibrio mediterranei]NOI21748.1 type 4a pilus biogenesis protein PilO [Vibrio mediterranei]PCD85661.1 MSHA biogenesis protein MshJ [Vibrio mediterranei]PRQ64554.1 MSHA biogenesis protein MshJ [Vibrio mediterranei]
MKDYWLKLDQRFLALSTREKSLLSICAFVIVAMMLYLLLLEPSLLQKSRLERQLQQVSSENMELEGQLSVLSSQLKQDPDKDINLEFNRLIAESQALSEQLSGLVDNLISPVQMTNLLELVLSKSQSLKLVALESLPPEPITGTDGASEYSGYFVHPVKIELTGNYFAIAKYLSELEQMPVKYYWRSFKYDVEKHPKARLILEVYTLGTRKEFIGG